MNLLYISEPIGKQGVKLVTKLLPNIKKEHNIDYTITCGDATSFGFGLSKPQAIQLKKNGVDLITTGDQAFLKKDMYDFISTSSFIIRPANYPKGVPGRYIHSCSVNDNEIIIINLQGMSGFNRQHLGNPFVQIDSILSTIKDKKIIIVDFHCATTSEKKSMFFHLKGRISALICSHTRIMTADHTVMNGTAYISDAGRTGSIFSVGGFDEKNEINKFISPIPLRSIEKETDLELQGLVINIDNESTKATRIQPIKVKPDSDF